MSSIYTEENFSQNHTQKFADIQAQINILNAKNSLTEDEIKQLKILISNIDANPNFIEEIKSSPDYIKDLKEKVLPDLEKRLKGFEDLEIDALKSRINKDLETKVSEVKKQHEESNILVQANLDSKIKASEANVASEVKKQFEESIVQANSNFDSKINDFEAKVAKEVNRQLEKFTKSMSIDGYEKIKTEVYNKVINHYTINKESEIVIAVSAVLLKRMKPSRKIIITTSIATTFGIAVLLILSLYLFSPVPNYFSERNKENISDISDSNFEAVKLKMNDIKEAILKNEYDSIKFDSYFYSPNKIEYFWEYNKNTQPLNKKEFQDKCNIGKWKNCEIKADVIYVQDAKQHNLEYKNDSIFNVKIVSDSKSNNGIYILNFKVTVK